MKHFLLIFLVSSLYTNSMAQEEMALYKVVPNSKPSENIEKTETAADGITRVSNVSQPTLTIYKPDKPNGTAVIICPGGGYRILAINHEGTDVAKALNQWGVTAFVLKYRLPDNRTMMDKSIGPLQDAQQSILLVREKAKEWGIDKKKVGIMGFSAGGHLAASASTRYMERLISNPKNHSLRPDFTILGYPVISFTDSLGHTGSRANLIGKQISEARIRKYSNEFNVTKKTPPAFLVHAKDDKGVPFNNSVAYLQALQKNKVPVTLKAFEKGGHGFGMHNGTTEEKWMDDLKLWMKEQGLLSL